MGTIRVANEVPNTPPVGNTEIFVDPADGKLKTKDSNGVVQDYTASNGITALTGEVAASGTGSVAATISNAAVLAKVLTGFVEGTGSISASDNILEAIQKLAARRNSAWFAEASDGAAVLSSDFTMTRDMYWSTLVINSGVILRPNGFRIFARDSIENNGTIERDGNSAIGISGGLALPAGTLSSAPAGGGGGAAAGAAGGASATALGGIGGAGGLGSGGAGGAAGGLTLVLATAGGTELFNSAHRAQVMYTTTNVLVTFGSGGGGGGGDGVAGGGGGGAGAGGIVISTRNLFGTGTIHANGGNGGQPAGGNRGGGGGGGGGVIVTITENNVTTTSLTLSVAGGVGGSGSGTGVSGASGSNGRIYNVRV